MASNSTDSNSSGNVPDSEDSGSFAVGEKVLAYHGPRLYKAKVQRKESRNTEKRYFVHYLGWNKNWDEWVSADRLMKYTEENLSKQRSVDRKQGVDKNIKSRRSAQAKPRGSADTKAGKEETKSNAAKGKKRKADTTIEKDDAAATEKQLKIQIPLSLRKKLLDDWEFITQQNKLVKLPRCPTVDEILTNYLDYRSKKDHKIVDSVGEILNGLRCYFDKALPVLLLYKKERQQYNEAVLDSVSPSSVYGAEHLLRLFVKLPELLALVKLEEETLIGLQENLLDFVKFLQKNQNTYFSCIYESIKASTVSGQGKDD